MTAPSSSCSSTPGRTARAPSCSSPTTSWCAWSPRCPATLPPAPLLWPALESLRSAKKSCQRRPSIRRLTRRRRPLAISSSSHSTEGTMSRRREGRDGPGCSDTCSGLTSILVRAARGRCAGPKRRALPSRHAIYLLGSGSNHGPRRKDPLRRSGSSCSGSGAELIARGGQGDPGGCALAPWTWGSAASSGRRPRLGRRGLSESARCRTGPLPAFRLPTPELAVRIPYAPFAPRRTAT